MNDNQIINKLLRIKKNSGNHSPSLKEIEAVVGYNPVKIDACFLSNPYATDLIYKTDIIDKINKNFYNLIESYPPNQNYLLEKLKIIEGIDPKYTLTLSGAQNCIELLLNSINYKNSLLPIPTYSSYYESINKNSKMHFIQLEEKNDFKIDCNSLYSTIQRKNIDLLILINPNNPTGLRIENKVILDLSKKFPDLKIIIDESFIHFIDDLESWKTFKKKLLKNKNLFFVKSMSKDFGIAGLRIGYLETKNKIINTLKESFGTWSLNNFAVEFLDLMSNDKFLVDYENARKKYICDKKIFYNELKKINSIKVFYSDSNFFLIKLNKIETSGFEMAMKLLISTGLYVRSMEDKIGLNSNFIRVASRSKKENKKIAKILTKLL